MQSFSNFIGIIKHLQANKSAHQQYPASCNMQPTFIQQNAAMNHQDHFYFAYSNLYPAVYSLVPRKAKSAQSVVHVFGNLCFTDAVSDYFVAVALDSNSNSNNNIVYATCCNQASVNSSQLRAIQSTARIILADRRK